ncbi:GNAT family N-acetyltransferase [Kovacikia minuta CCNUW1]|uniref:GNAT family N-acetyltransferase n=1 Tax=Kovacikia minuta TaxID=2931930 RepID=UPI001CCD7371|nr:GNAT family N-acetyltransferase [Kovacikia minuta]UBF28054.1 GNAT family N-acetyltransferase [Kovacikia minuta CCNUW1]
MKFLLDTNIIIPAEPTSPNNIESSTASVTELLRVLAEGNHQFYIHDESIKEICGDRDKLRREMRQILLRKYLTLPNAPKTTKKIDSTLRNEALNRHDQVDLMLLAAVDADAVDYLVTDDRGLHKKASRLGLETRVATPIEAISIVRALFPVVPIPPPAVKSIYAHELNQEDPIFDSLREDYPKFDTWLTKCKREHRQAWIIDSLAEEINGLCIVKPEDYPEYDVPTPTLKICTLKVSEKSRGYRYGELLLKTVFDYTSKNDYSSIYITTFPKQVELINLLENFGFQPLSLLSNVDEFVFSKALKFSPSDYELCSPLEFNIRFGPHQAKFDGVQAFMVPIVPKYHKILFPESETQLELLSGRHPSGNGISKAYLCHANIRRINSGDLLFFYRSRKTGGITAYGVVESIAISNDPSRIAHFVGKRTVYTFPEIEGMCFKEVLAISFRLACSLTQPIPIQDLIHKGWLRASPQSIVTLPIEAARWLKTRFEASF